MREGCVHKEGSQSGDKAEDAGVIMQLKVTLGNVHAHTPHLLKAGFVNSLINVKRTPYMLKVKQIYNCLSDYVPSQSCKNTTSNKFLLLDTKKEERKIFDSPIVLPEKGNKTETGNKCSLSPEAHLQLPVYFPLKVS